MSKTILCCVVPVFISFFLPELLIGGEICDKNTVCIYDNQSGSKVDFSAKNLKTFEITITIEFDTISNMESNVRLPYTFALNGNSANPIFSIWQDNKSLGWEYNYRYFWTFGPLDAEHDDSYVYSLPYEKGSSFNVGQGFNGSFSHTGDFRYAIDWDMPEGTQVLAARDGIVVGIEASYSGGGAEDRYRDYANYVMIKHTDKTIGEYDHFKKGGVLVRVGQKVKTGDLIGYSGNVGFSSGPHLHFVVYKAISGKSRESFPITFDTKEGNGIVLKQGSRYTNPGAGTSSRVTDAVDSKSTNKGAEKSGNNIKISIGEISATRNVEYNGETGIRFDVGAVNAEGLYGKKIHFGFNVKQDKWIQWIGLKSEKVAYDPCHWESGGWYFYPYNLLTSRGKALDPFTGVFYVMDSSTNKSLGEKKIVFYVEGSESDTLFDEDLF